MSLHGPATGRLLDVGCGDGTFLDRMRWLGWEVEGIEPDPQAAQSARERYGLAIRSERIEDAGLPESGFDAVTMNHAIEHVPDPVRVLAMISRSLRAGGTFVARTPNLESFGHRVFQDAWMHLDPPRHLHLFSPATLRACAEAAGLAVRSLRTSTLSAAQTYVVSRSIRASGHASLARSTSLRGRAFGLLEDALHAVRGDSGEEIVLVATR